MKRKILTTVALLLCVGATFAYFAGIGGNWHGTFKGPDGNEYQAIYNFETAGTKLAGYLTLSIGSFPISNGVVKGDSLWFTANVNDQMIKNMGRYYAEGDSISLQIGPGLAHTTLQRGKHK